MRQLLLTGQCVLDALFAAVLEVSGAAAARFGCDGVFSQFYASAAADGAARAGRALPGSAGR
jgi:hypothetical protein